MESYQKVVNQCHAFLLHDPRLRFTAHIRVDNDEEGSSTLPNTPHGMALPGPGPGTSSKELAVQDHFPCIFLLFPHL